MDFRDVFISYRIGRKEINTFFRFRELPFHRQVAVVLLSGWLIFSLLWNAIYEEELIFTMLIFLGMVFVISFFENTVSNLQYMKKLYHGHDEKRMSLIKRVLNEHQIDCTDAKKLDLLIDEAKEQQNNNLFAGLFSQYHSVMVTMLIAFCNSYVGKITSDGMRMDNIIYIIIFFSVFVLSVDIVCASFRDICLLVANGDYYIYEAFIHDLRQLKIFQNK